jgi:hypothetical protein
VALALGLVIGPAEPVSAQQIRSGVLTCDVSAGMGLILGSQKLLSCRFSPEGPGRREDYDGSITKFGLDLGLTRSGVMVWAVFSNTVAGPGFLAGDYFGASVLSKVAASASTACASSAPCKCSPESKLVRRDDLVESGDVRVHGPYSEATATARRNSSAGVGRSTPKPAHHVLIIRRRNTGMGSHLGWLRRTASGAPSQWLAAFVLAPARSDDIALSSQGEFTSLA